tara:strand:+ start:4152 stop:8198 length:4047 start_codon:yes stop_codon:yes gene_type:complete
MYAIDSAFEPIRSFDMPSVALQQLLSGGSSLEAVRNLADPDKRAYLTPKEQASLTNNLKDQYGADNPILRTMIGIATNPFVWAGALISPAGAEALRKGRTIFGHGNHVSKVIDRHGGLFDMAGITSPQQLLDGTNIAIGLKTDEHLRKIFMAESEEAFNQTLIQSFKGQEKKFTDLGMKGAPENFDDFLEYIARKEGIDPKYLTRDVFEGGYIPKDPNLIPKGTTAERVREIVEDITSLESIVLSGRHKVVTSTIDTLHPTAKIEIVGKTEEEARKLLKQLRGEEFSDKFRNADDFTGDGIYEISYNKKTGASNSYLDLLSENQKLSKAGKMTEHNLQPLDFENTRHVKFTKDLDPLMDESAAQKLIDHYDLQPFLDAQRNSYNMQVVNLMGDVQHFKDTGEFIVDKRKLKTLASAFNTKNPGAALFNSRGLGEEALGQDLSATGLDMLASILGHDLSGVTIKGIKQADRMMEVWASEAQRLVNSGTYVPRNTYAPVTELHGGVKQSTYKIKGDIDYSSLADTAELTPRTMHERQLHPEAIDWLLRKHADQGIHTGHQVERLKKMRKKVQSEIDYSSSPSGGEVPLIMMTLDGRRAARGYTKSGSELWSRFTPHFSVSPTGELVIDKNVWGALIEAEETIKKRGGLPAGKGVPLSERFHTGRQWRQGVDAHGQPVSADWSVSLLDLLTTHKHLQPEGGITLADVIASDWHAIKGFDKQQEYVRDVIIPHMSGRIPPEGMMMRALGIKTREQMIRFANGKIGQMIEGFGPRGEEFISGIREMGNFRDPSGAIARSLYVGFLGLNMSSVMLNMMQPLIHATMYGGLTNVLPAYKDAFMEMAAYGRERMKIPRARLTAQEYSEIHKKAFKHVGDGVMGDVLGMTPDVIANLEGVSYTAGKAYGVESKLKYGLQTFPMKFFEKAELFNRLVSAHTVDRMYKSAGRRVPHTKPGDSGTWTKDDSTYYQWLNDVNRFVQETQFGGSPLNMPMAFMGGSGLPTGKLLASPLNRMFLNFPTRAFSSWLRTGQQISPTRRIRGTNLDVIPWWAGDAARLMGTGAIAYEVGKEMFGYDVSRGVGMAPVVEVMDAGWVPPVVQIPLDMVKVARGDLEFAKSAIPGLVPGGIGLVRAMGMMPDLGNQPFVPELAGSLQREFVDWNTTTPDGMHPVYKGDGSLVNYEKPFNIVMRGLGINIGTHPKAGELDGYLVKQRELIVKMESDYLMALINNNVPKARGIQTEFKKKFGVPMKISKSQLRSKMRSLHTARTERIANTIPSEYRELYSSTLMEQAPKMGMTPAEVMSGSTSRKRTQAGVERHSAVRLDPTTIEEIKKLLAEEVKPIEEQGFNPFSKWNQ